MLTILHVFTCDHCGMGHVDRQGEWEPGRTRLEYIAPSGWNWINGKLVCWKHRINVKSIHEPIPKRSVPEIS